MELCILSCEKTGNKMSALTLRLSWFLSHCGTNFHCYLISGGKMGMAPPFRQNQGKSLEPCTEFSSWNLYLSRFSNKSQLWKHRKHILLTVGGNSIHFRLLVSISNYSLFLLEHSPADFSLPHLPLRTIGSARDLWNYQKAKTLRSYYCKIIG